MSRLSDFQKRTIVFVASAMGALKDPKFWMGFKISEENQAKILDVAEKLTELTEVFGLYKSEAEDLKKQTIAGKYVLRVLNNLEYEEHNRRYKIRRLPVRQDAFDDIVYHAIKDNCSQCNLNPKKCGLNNALKIAYQDYDPNQRIIICPKQNHGIEVKGSIKCEYCDEIGTDIKAFPGGEGIYFNEKENKYYFVINHFSNEVNSAEIKCCPECGKRLNKKGE